MQAGAYTLTLTMMPTTEAHQVRSWFGMQSSAGTVRGPYFNVDPFTTHTMVVTTDPEKHQFAGTLDGIVHMDVTSRGQQQPIHSRAPRPHRMPSRSRTCGDATHALSEPDRLSASGR